MRRLDALNQMGKQKSSGRVIKARKRSDEQLQKISEMQEICIGKVWDRQKTGSGRV